MGGEPPIGFAGIGLMGRPLVRRLLAAGYPVTVWNRTAGKVDDLVAAGATVAATAAELRRGCEVVMLCLADTAAVAEVVFGENGVASAAGRADANAASLLVDFSSIEPEATRAFAARLQAACGMRWVDAPVSGGVTGAEQGTLAVMAGGEPRDIAILRPLMAAVSHRFTHMGAVGAGQVTKLCNQMIVGCNVLVLAEVIALARRAGIDAGRLPQALAGGFADSPPLQLTGPMMAADRTEPVRWKVRTLLKDLDSAAQLARREASAAPFTALAAQLLRLHGEHGLLDADPATLVRLYLDTAAGD